MRQVRVAVHNVYTKESRVFGHGRTLHSYYKYSAVLTLSNITADLQDDFADWPGKREN